MQEWVTATDIRIVLTRMNTFGDEVFGDPRVLKSYFYAISDLAVGARYSAYLYIHSLHVLLVSHLLKIVKIFWGVK